MEELDERLSVFGLLCYSNVLSRMMLRAEERNMLEGFRVGLRSILTRVIFLASTLIRIISVGWPCCLTARLLLAYTLPGSSFGRNPIACGFWDLVIERISRRLDGWKKTYLSFGGRITLIH
ncbi:hypothetical protein CK203_107564 [Vitis vinifera]|uniref:Uncharacterized protein n=1 Tax=Vitis vinifera TaxID=29760 RepID=A0A438DC30_VITVI|nr:hypothetical protein CK203_107564 [Vitis vinifera]